MAVKKGTGEMAPRDGACTMAGGGPSVSDLKTQELSESGCGGTEETLLCTSTEDHKEETGAHS